MAKLRERAEDLAGVESFGALRDGEPRASADGFGDATDGAAGQIVQLGDDLAGHQVADRDGQLGALVIVEQFEQVGDVGRVERLDQFVDCLGVALLERILDAAERLFSDLGIRGVSLRAKALAWTLVGTSVWMVASRQNLASDWASPAHRPSATRGSTP